MRSILVTSPNASEGKSTVAKNLALAYARSGSNVLLIDADMHNPTQSGFFDLPNSPGLAEHLEGVHLAEVSLSGDENLSILPAGSANSPPSQLLGSPEVVSFLRRLTESYEIVIIDSPPLLPVADTRTLARVADATVMVSMANSTSTTQLSEAVALLKQVQVTLLGGVLNNVDAGPSDNYYGAK